MLVLVEWGKIKFKNNKNAGSAEAKGLTYRSPCGGIDRKKKKIFIDSSYLIDQ